MIGVLECRGVSCVPGAFERLVDRPPFRSQVVRRSRDEALHRIAETRNQLEEPEIVTVAPLEQGGGCLC